MIKTKSGEGNIGRQFKNSYAKTKFFGFYSEFFEDLYKKDWQFIADLNVYQLEFFLKELGINVELKRSSRLDLDGEKNEAIIEMCKKLDASKIVFGKNGIDYVDPKEYISQGITPIFQDYQHPIYEQRFGDFISHLSIIDLLFNCGPDSLSVLMSGNLSKGEL